MKSADFDAVIVGGGPAGLSAALTLGRARKRVLLCDAGPRRNAAAEHMHGFLTRDGIAPAEFRRIGREQLRPYDLEVRDVGVHQVKPLSGAGFELSLVDGTTVRCRRILLATGMVDEVPDVPGIRDHWGRSVFLCPYCHGWELIDRRWGMLATNDAQLEYAIFLTGWVPGVIAFSHGRRDISPELQARLDRAGVQLETRRIRKLVTGADRSLEALELEDGTVVPREVLVVRPPQRQVSFVQRLGVTLDEQGYVRVDGHCETSIPGIHAAGDLSSPMQAALLSAAAGTRAAFMVNHALNMEAAR